ncbi:ribosome assembly protein 3 [Maudiozyma exigua]|uniref:Ribosome assembly protein 3 n=1 Tax=Maudiozyma exigua TaxID=34358 RepID=A0A9P6W2P3_MAUEX|nr:ribosome assembly protein 3 [Kazachstania exigua]
MSVGDIAAAKQKAGKKSRRRKKRRTADSSDSESSSSSDNESQNMEIEETHENAEISDVELSDNESSKKGRSDEQDKESLDKQTKEKLSNIPFTTTQLTQKGGNNVDKKANLDLKKVDETIEQANTELKNSKLIQENGEASKNLKNEYLGLMFQNYGEDINDLRNAPDFTNKSLVLLANVLKEGSNMFETDSLKTILESK